eukprot:1647455-Rhodomonas_salina.2
MSTWYKICAICHATSSTERLYGCTTTTGPLRRYAVIVSCTGRGVWYLGAGTVRSRLYCRVLTVWYCAVVPGAGRGSGADRSTVLPYDSDRS